MPTKTLSLSQIQQVEYFYEYKFVLENSKLDSFIDALRQGSRVLEIDGKNIINYQSWYYDDDNWSISRGNFWGRFFNKLRLRKYENQDIYYLQAKSLIDNCRQKLNLKNYTHKPPVLNSKEIFEMLKRPLTKDHTSLFRSCYKTIYDRQSWFSSGLEFKITIDQNLRFERARNTQSHRILDGFCILEIKTKKPLYEVFEAFNLVQKTPSLRRLGIGKFGLGMSLH